LRLRARRGRGAARRATSPPPAVKHSPREQGPCRAVPTSERTTSAESGSELPWWQWVDRRIEACLEAHSESVGTAIGEYCGPQVAALKRELELLQREIVQLREQVGLERGLRDLRREVEDARAQTPKIPEIAARLEAGQERLQRELETAKTKLKRVRVDQSMADFN
jgi:hypothetical protein